MGAIAMDFAAITAIPQVVSLPPPVMKGLRKRVWLILYTEGGMWTAAEIAHRLGLSPRKMHAELGSMVREGFLVRKRVTTVDGDTLVKYGVAGNCSIPRGVTPDEIADLIRLAAG